MKYIQGLTINEKYRLIILSVILCAAILGLSAWKIVNSFNEQRQATEQIQELEARLLRIRNNVLRGELLQMFIADRVTQQEYIKDADETIQERIKTLTDERKLVNTRELPENIAKPYAEFSRSIDAYLAFVEKNLNDVQTVSVHDSARYANVRNALLIDLNREFTPLRENATKVVKETQDYKNKIIQDFDQQRQIMLWLFGSIALVVLIGIIVFIYIVSRSIIVSIAQTRSILERLSEGELPSIEHQPGKNELAAMQNALYIFTRQMRSLMDFAGNVAKNNFEMQATMFDGKGAIAQALIDMRDNLRYTSEQEHERKWLTQGIAEFGNIVRRHSDQHKLYDQALSFIIKYTSASLGTLFVSDDRDAIDATQRTLQRVAVYAYSRKKYINGTIRAGEGLAGQAFLERAVITMNEVPDDYLKIESGLGQAQPAFIVVSPLILDGEPYGVLELASFKEIEKYKINFIVSISQELASVIKIAQANARTHYLLEETKQKEEKLRANEDAMQQAIEELHAARQAEATRAEELERSNKQLETQKLLMEKTLSEIRTKEQELKVKDQSLMDTRMANLHAQASQLSVSIKTLIDVALDASRTCAHVFTVFAEAPRLFVDARTQANLMLQSILKNNPSFLATYTLWEPNQFDGKDTQYIGNPGHDATGRFIPYWTIRGNDFCLEPLLNYTQDGAGDYFILPQRTRQEAVIDPYIYQVQGKDTWILSAVAPVMVGDDFKGICGVDFAVDSIMEMIDTLKWIETGITVALIAYNKTIVRISDNSIATGQSCHAFIPEDRLSKEWNKPFEVIWDNCTYLLEPVQFGNTQTPWLVCVRTQQM
jgi:hypothetical protein